MSGIKRYQSSLVIEMAAGEYVKYEDHAARVAKLETDIDRLTKYSKMHFTNWFNCSETLQEARAEIEFFKSVYEPESKEQAT